MDVFTVTVAFVGKDQAYFCAKIDFFTVVFLAKNVVYFLAKSAFLAVVSLQNT